MDAERMAAWEKRIREDVVQYLPPLLATAVYSWGRRKFLDTYVEDAVDDPYTFPDEFHRELWGLEFQGPIMPAAGIFKDGRGYDVVADEGAAAYMGGTVTAMPRKGNKEDFVRTPFIPLPRSEAALNDLGLPGDGDQQVAERLQQVEKQEGCPLGCSIMEDPNLEGEDALHKLVNGMHVLEQVGDVDFIELNESCPNTEEILPQESGLANRLEYIADEYLEGRSPSHRPPVVVKFSTDTDPADVPGLVDMLLEYGFDGVNLGNTSTAYEEHMDMIVEEERAAYKEFVERFDGGISGKPLREPSLQLATEAQNHADEHATREFHVIRTGGVSTPADILASELAGISMNEWYTGFFDRFADHGHGTYREIGKNLKPYTHLLGEDAI